MYSQQVAQHYLVHVQDRSVKDDRWYKGALPQKYACRQRLLSEYGQRANSRGMWLYLMQAAILPVQP